MPEDTDIRFPQMVRDLREQLGLTQEQFAAKIGVTWSTVNRWENGRGNPSPLALQNLKELVKNVPDLTDALRDEFSNM